MGYRSKRGSSPPTWFIFLLGMAFVFGIFYLWTGVQSYLRTGLSVAQSTEQALILDTATAEQVFEQLTDAPTALPTFTPVPPCHDFVVRVPSAIIREQPTTTSNIVDSISENETVCVIGREVDSDWYLIDFNPRTRRLEAAYMHEDIIEALNPTMTPSMTFTPAPTITPLPTLTPSATQNIELATPTKQPDPTETESPTATSQEKTVNL